MRFRPKAKLKAGQVQDLRAPAGGAKRVSANATNRRMGSAPADGADKAEPDYVDDMRRHNHLTYKKELRPVGHNRGSTVGNDKDGYTVFIPDKPDGADKAPKPKPKPAIGHPRRVNGHRDPGPDGADNIGVNTAPQSKPPAVRRHGPQPGGGTSMRRQRHGRTGGGF